MSDTSGTVAEPPIRPTESVIEPVPMAAALRGPVPQDCGWGQARCILFRFGLIYFVLYFLPFPLVTLVNIGAVLPTRWADGLGNGIGWLAQQFENGTNAITVWFGEHILGLSKGAIVIQLTGSGDTMLAYVQACWMALLAIAGAAAWSIADRKRKGYPRLYGAFRMYVRLALASILLGYGLAKIPPAQFQPPGADQLFQTYGNSSPMGLLWKFMGASPAYTMFAGLAEVSAALLLAFRRTSTLGGLVGAGVMLNVVALNFCYDVPVKLYASHLFLAALVVAMPDLPRLANVLILNRPTAPSPLGRRFDAKWKNRLLVGVELAFIAIMIGPGVWHAIVHFRDSGMNAPRASLYGLYEVESFELNGEARPPLLTDESRWRRFAVLRYGKRTGGRSGPDQVWDGSAAILNMADQKEWFSLRYEGDRPDSIQLRPRGQKEGPFWTLSWTEPEPGHVELAGPFKGGKIRVTMRLKPDSEFEIYKRGFNWVQELPYNR
jgi:hypothetical protein